MSKPIKPQIYRTSERLLHRKLLTAQYELTEAVFGFVLFFFFLSDKLLRSISDVFYCCF